MDFIFDPSLVLYLPLYELDGSSFMSKDAYGHLCTATGAVWRPNGRYFDGTDDVIDCGSSSVIKNFSAQTILLWMNTALKAGVSYRHVIDTGRWASPYGYCFNIDDGANILTCMIRNTGESSQVTSTFTDDTWEQFGVVWDGANLYSVKNGLIGTATAHAGATTSARNLYIARRADSAGNYFDGYIGELLIYSRALTPQEVQHIYLATKWRYK